MRAVVASSYLEVPNEALDIIWIKIGDHPAPVKAEIPLGGFSDLSISWELDIKKVLEGTKLETSSNIYFAIEGICEYLRVRETIKFWKIDLEQPILKFEDTIGQIPNALINNGLVLSFSICVTDPIAANDQPLACDLDGGILLRTDVVVSARGEGVLFPIEFCNYSHNEDPTWQIDLDLDLGLSAPASSALQVKVSAGSALERGLAADRNSNEWLAAIGTLVHAIQTECLIRVFESEEILTQLQAATDDIANLDRGHWAQNEKTIGFQLNNWMQRYCAGLPFLEIAADFKSDPLGAIIDLRKCFLRRNQ